jgi:hypothetical protein
MRVPLENWTMPWRPSGYDMKNLSDYLDAMGNYLQAAAMAIEMAKCYKECECPNDQE